MSQTQAKQPKNLKGIRGWLIVPAIHLIIGIVATPFLAILTLIAYALTVEGAPPLPGFLAMVLFEVLIIVLMGIGFIVVARKFFAKKKETPRYFMFFVYGVLVADLIVLGVEWVWAVTEGAVYFKPDVLKELLLTNAWFIGPGAVWAVIYRYYFQDSKRVKATFVK